MDGWTDGVSDGQMGPLPSQASFGFNFPFAFVPNRSYLEILIFVSELGFRVLDLRSLS